MTARDGSFSNMDQWHRQRIMAPRSGWSVAKVHEKLFCTKCLAVAQLDNLLAMDGRSLGESRQQWMRGSSGGLDTQQWISGSSVK